METWAEIGHLLCQTGVIFYNSRLFSSAFNAAEWTNTHITTVSFKHLSHSSLSLLSVHPPATPFPLPPLVKKQTVCMCVDESARVVGVRYKTAWVAVGEGGGGVKKKVKWRTEAKEKEREKQESR